MNINTDFRLVEPQPLPQFIETVSRIGMEVSYINDELMKMRDPVNHDDVLLKTDADDYVIGFQIPFTQLGYPIWVTGRELKLKIVDAKDLVGIRRPINREIDDNELARIHQAELSRISSEWDGDYQYEWQFNNMVEKHLYNLQARKMEMEMRKPRLYLYTWDLDTSERFVASEIPTEGMSVKVREILSQLSGDTYLTDEEAVQITGYFLEMGLARAYNLWDKWSLQTACCFEGNSREFVDHLVEKTMKDEQAVKFIVELFMLINLEDFQIEYPPDVLE